jgi:hypothetical protein
MPGYKGSAFMQSRSELYSSVDNIYVCVCVEGNIPSTRNNRLLDCQWNVTTSFNHATLDIKQLALTENVELMWQVVVVVVIVVVFVVRISS